MNKIKNGNKRSTQSVRVSYWSHFVSFLKNERTHFASGVIMLLFTTYLFISLVSFIISGASDQSIIENIPFLQITNYQKEVMNWGGPRGAYLANLLVNNWMGISCLFGMLFLTMLSLHLMRIHRINIIKWFFTTLACMLWLSLASAFFLDPLMENFFLRPGGTLGSFWSELLSKNIGWPGTFLFILGYLTLLIIFTYKKTYPFMQRFLPDYVTDKLNETISQEETESEVVIKETSQPEMFTQEEEEEEEEEIAETETTPIEEETETFPITEIEVYENKSENDEPEEDTDHTSKWNEERIEETCIIPETSIPDRTAMVISNSEPEFSINKIEEEEIFTPPTLERYDPTLDLSHYKYPTMDLLKQYSSRTTIDAEEQKSNKQTIIQALEDFKIKISKIEATVGPTITLYEIVPAPGVRISRIKNLENDIAMNLSALSVRIIAPIPGKGTIGIEVPNKDPQTVSMQSILFSRKFQESHYDLPIALGKTISNEVFMFDLCKAPHVLVAGATGQGKSVGLNAIISSLLYKKHPSQLKFVLIDPKKVEFSFYSSIERHFLAKLPDEEEAIITDVTKVVQTLNSLTKEMDTRYDLLKKARAKNIKEYNEKFISRQLNPEKGHKYMPYIVVVIDEFGDLIMTAGKDVELPIARIAQLARAVGIHMIIATQRPSVSIITGTIKANFPTRIAFRVASMMDSRTILDSPGANQLIGRGDLLFSQGSDQLRIQCAFIDTPEIENITEFIGKQAGYPTAFLLPEYEGDENNGDNHTGILTDKDPLFEEAAYLLVSNQQGSTSLIQRKFSIGYNRAGRIIDQLQAAGIVGPFEGAKARQVLVQDTMQLEEKLKAYR